MRVLITGGAGFIGSNLCKYLLDLGGYEILIVDRLSYSANIDVVDELKASKNYNFVKSDICDSIKLEKILFDFQPESIFHLAAESHVDRSIAGPSEFIQSNIIGTYCLLEGVTNFLQSMQLQQLRDFKFIHISTDEVYGDLGEEGLLSNEDSPYKPSSPYSASKASSDFLVKAWMRTYRFPGIITHCTNNFGPYQHQEKLVPNSIIRLLKNEQVPIYGNGQQIRDWLFVTDHVEALELILREGDLYETYNIGAHNQIKNLDLIYFIISVLSTKLAINETKLKGLIQFVEDRPGHDKCYGLDCSKIKNNLGWQPKNSLHDAIQNTVDWFIENHYSDK